ncbi:5'-methylthioadenosine/S-adenosylhomocysteine nucleosidase [Caulobacter segnis]|jgi:adenosylhomocysteine nucleosidase|uniref:5'-methylthioadenosine/S-adenosylhomocysteine nucleosidase n=1 Tax=Caulobacter segnis TaxID=88688 RepID=UPI001CC19CFE|nr:5'-methylthioadenosine/S-adenosylhomocysteine nucleosidase [Caulobacter segnis]UAL09073.1 5'-methylthioadenosine/S-adenosylhomocysteine nucleosidase [Caulobacter segnis]
MRLPALVLALLCLIASPLFGSPAWAQRLDETPRVAVISAFPPEIVALNAATSQQKTFDVNGVTFMTGQLEGKPVVVFLSGVSMVNAAMTTQMALDRFNITRIVFSGIAGGVDERLDIGDVVVADQWAQNLESAFARETDKGFELAPSIRTAQLANFGMIFPRGIHMPGDALGAPARVWFPADPALLDTAREVAAQVALQRCAADKCLVHPPKVVVGGNGVSAPVFLDNAAYRKYLRATFEARVVDMESAAVAHVALVSKTPFIAFRSLSDLAGGGAGANEMHTFMALASDNSATVVKAFVKALPN